MSIDKKIFFNPMPSATKLIKEHSLKIDDIINDQLNEFDPGQDDSFESFELFTIHRIINYFFNKKDRASISEIIRNRETSFWFNKHKHGYLAVLNAEVTDAYVPIDSLFL